MSDKFERAKIIVQAIEALAQSEGKYFSEIDELYAELRRELWIGKEKARPKSDDPNYIRYKLAIKEIAGNPGLSRDEYMRLRSTNKQIWSAFKDITNPRMELYLPRCSGVTTSLIALAKTFENIVIVVPNEGTALEYERNGIDVVDERSARGKRFEGKLVIFEAGAKPIDVNAFRVINIRQIDFYGDKVTVTD